jgi:hypothetical protein
MSIIGRRKPEWLILQEPLDRFESADLAGGGGRANYLKEFYDFPEPDTFRRLQVGSTETIRVSF